MTFDKDRVYVHIPVYRLLEDMDGFLGLGLNAEIYITAKFIDNYKKSEIKLIRNSLERRSISSRVHAPFIDLNPGSSDNRVKGLSKDRLIDALELSVGLGAKGMVAHSHFEPVFYRRHFREWFENSKEVWHILSRQSKAKGMPVCIENSIDDSTRPVLTILKNFPYFKACFDVAHYNVFYAGGWKKALAQYPSGSIREFHLSDNDGDKDSHMPLGEGSIRFKDFFRELARRKESPVFTIEPHSRGEISKSLRFIRRLLDED